MATYISKYFTAEEIDQRLLQGYYDDAVSNGFKGSFEDFKSLLAKIPKIESNSESINAIKVNINELSTALAEGDFMVAISNLANAVKNGSIKLESLDGSLRLSNTVVDNLDTENTLMPLSANQGVVLKTLIDALSRKTVYLTKEQYKDLETNGEIIADVEYNIIEDE